MMYSEEEHEGEPPSGSRTMAMTGFLFGNIDEKGELESDFLDEVSSPSDE